MRKVDQQLIEIALDSHAIVFIMIQTLGKLHRDELGRTKDEVENLNTSVFHSTINVKY